MRKTNNHPIKETMSDRIFIFVDYFLLSIVLIIVLYPLIYILSASFSSTEAVISGKVWLWPVEPSLMGYKAVFKEPQVFTGYKNSIIYTVLGTTINLIFTMLAAYPLSFKILPGKKIIMILFTFTMLFGGGLIPSYLVVKKLGMLDSIWAMIIPGAMSVYQVIITRTFIQSSIPYELYEAAEIDTCNEIQYLLRIVLPLSKPIIAVNTLMFAVGHWNSYFNALIYLSDSKLFPLQIVLRDILIQNDINESITLDASTMMQKQGLKQLLKYSLIVVASVPVLAIYPFVQKHFVKGVMIGSLKG